MKTKTEIFIVFVEQCASKSQKILSAKKEVTKHKNKIMGHNAKAEFDVFIYNKPIL